MCIKRIERDFELYEKGKEKSEIVAFIITYTVFSLYSEVSSTVENTVFNVKWRI